MNEIVDRTDAGSGFTTVAARRLIDGGQIGALPRGRLAALDAGLRLVLRV